MEPVDPREAPTYYKVIKEPMGKIWLFTLYNGELILLFVLKCESSQSA